MGLGRRWATRIAAVAAGVVLMGGLVAMARPSEQEPEPARGVPVSGPYSDPASGEPESAARPADPPDTLEERLEWEQRAHKGNSYTTNIESLIDPDDQGDD